MTDEIDYISIEKYDHELFIAHDFSQDEVEYYGFTGLDQHHHYGSLVTLLLY